jgi:ribonuclease Y
MLKNLVVIDALSVGAWIGILCGAVVLSAVATFFIVKLILGSKTKNADHNAQQILRDAQIKAERITKNAEIDAKQAAFEARQQADNDIRARKGELAGEEQKLSLREQAIDQRDAALVQKENALDAKNDAVDRETRRRR